MKKIFLAITTLIIIIISVNSYRYNYYLVHKKPLNNQIVEKWVKVILNEEKKSDINFKLGENYEPKPEELVSFFKNNPKYFEKYSRNQDFLLAILYGKMHYFVDSFFLYKISLLEDIPKPLILYNVSSILWEISNDNYSEDNDSCLNGEALFLATENFPGPFTYYQHISFYRRGYPETQIMTVLLRYPSDFIEYELEKDHGGKVRPSSIESVLSKNKGNDYLTDAHIKQIAWSNYPTPQEIMEKFNKDDILDPFEIDYLIAYWSSNINRNYKKAAYYADMRDPKFLPDLPSQFLRNDSKAYEPTMRIVNQIKAYRGAGRYQDAIKIYNDYGMLINEKVHNFEQVALEIGACYAGLGNYDLAIDYLKQELTNTEVKNSEYSRFIRKGAENITVSEDENKGILIYSIYRLTLDLPEYDIFFKIGRGEEIIKIVKNGLARYQRNPIMPEDWDRGYDPEIYGRLEELLQSQ